MKFNVYIKILTAFLVIFLIFVLAFFNYLKSVETEIVINAGKTMSQGLLISLENELKKLLLSVFVLDMEGLVVTVKMDAFI